MKAAGIVLSTAGRLHRWSAHPSWALYANVQTRPAAWLAHALCIAAVCISGVSSGKDARANAPALNPPRQWHHYSSDFAREQHGLFKALDETGPSSSEHARTYWSKEQRLHVAAGGLTHAPPRDRKKGTKHAELCPPNSLPSKQSRCICRIGYGCTGSDKFCQVGKSNRKVQHRLEGWLIKRCPHCRCDPMECKEHRKACDKNCQRAIKKTNIDQPSAARLRLEVQFLSKVMCIITSPSGPKVKAAISSWAKLCDGLLVVTFENNTLMNRSSIEEQYQGVRFLQLPKVPGQTLSTDFGSSMAAWRFIKASFVDRFGWFISVPDATLVIIANLKRYLSLLDYNPETRGKPIFAGHPVHLRSGLVVNTLRAGVILNRKALAALIQSAFDHATGTKLTFEPLECTSFAESTNATDEFDRLTVAYQTLRGDDHFVARQGKQRTALDVLPFDMQTRILSKPRKLMPTGGSADAGARPEMASAGNRGQEQEPEPEQKKEWKEEKENDDEIKREENAMLPDPCPLWKLGKRLSFEETTCDEGQPGMPAEFCIALLLSSNGVRPHDTRDLSEAHRFHILPANATALTKPWGKLSEEQQQKTEPYPNLPGESGVSRQTITMPVRPGLRHIRELEALTAFLGKKCYPLVLSKDFDDEFGRGARLLEKQRVYRWLRRRCTLAVGEMLDGWIAPTTSTRTTTSNPALESNPRRLVKQPKEPPPFNASKCRQVNWSEVNFTDANIDTAVYTMTELMPALEHLARLGNFTLESRPTL